MNETTRLYTRDGIKTIDYEVYLKLQKHCEEIERKLAICKNALRTIKHTECDTYKVSARALTDTKEVDRDGE